MPMEKASRLAPIDTASGNIDDISARMGETIEEKKVKAAFASHLRAGPIRHSIVSVRDQGHARADEATDFHVQRQSGG